MVRNRPRHLERKNTHKKTKKEKSNNTKTPHKGRCQRYLQQWNAVPAQFKSSSCQACTAEVFQAHLLSIMRHQACLQNQCLAACSQGVYSGGVQDSQAEGICPASWHPHWLKKHQCWLSRDLRRYHCLIQWLLNPWHLIRTTCQSIVTISIASGYANKILHNFRKHSCKAAWTMALKTICSNH